MKTAIAPLIAFACPFAENKPFVVQIRIQINISHETKQLQHHTKTHNVVAGSSNVLSQNSLAQSPAERRGGCAAPIPSRAALLSVDTQQPTIVAQPRHLLGFGCDFVE
jgi:hypothetical protein